MSFWCCRHKSSDTETMLPVEEETTVKVSDSQIKAQKMKVELQEIWRLSENNKRILQDSIEIHYGAGSMQAFEFWKKQKQLDSINYLRIENLIVQNGWPKISVVGKGAVSMAQQVIARQGAEAMTKFLPVLKNAYMQKDADGLWIAEWEDRICVEQKIPQRYGTQGKCRYLANGEQSCRAYPIADTAGLDDRRKQLGLNSFADYAREKGWNDQ